MKIVLNLMMIFIGLRLIDGWIYSKPVPAQTAIILNGGFETDPSSYSNGWIWPATDWIWDGSFAHGGTHSARVSREIGRETETASVWSDYIPIQPSTTYTLTYWMRTENASFWPSIMLFQYTNGQIQAGSPLIAYANIENGTGDWKRITYRFQTLPTAEKLRLRLYLYISTTGSFWFDDFNLDQGFSAHFPYQAGFPVVTANSGWVTWSSPVVADIDHDGDNELLVGAGNAVNGWDKHGNSLTNYPLITGDRSIIAQIALADINRDSRLEIAAGTRSDAPEGQCRVYVWQSDGSLLNGWPRSVAWHTQDSNNDCWITSVVQEDIDGDGDLEILASSTNNSSGNPSANVTPQNLYAWQTSGAALTGIWPNGHTTAGFYGPIAAGDLNNDGKKDILASRDHHYLNAYSGTGVSLPGWPIETYLYRNSGNYQTDYRIVHGLGAPVLADLDGDGVREYIIASNVNGPGSSVTILFSALLVLEPDGTRSPGWETPALGGPALSQDDLPRQAPAIADLNQDGQLEIIVATNDGWIRAYEANKQTLWAFDFTQGATLFASEPVVGDIDGDSGLEVVFGTHVPIQPGGNWDGPVGLWALEPDGSVVPGFPMAVPTPGVKAAPTLADVDGDGDLEILVATITGQTIVWDTTTPSNTARLPWPTGRHDFRRSANYTPLMPFDFNLPIISK